MISEKRELNHLRRIETPRLTQAAADLLATLHQQAVQVIDHAVQLRAVIGVQHWRDVAVIQPHVVVVALFSDVRHADGGPFCRQIFLQHQGQTQAAKLNRRLPDRHRVVVFHLLFKGNKTRQRRLLLAENHLFTATATNRQRKHHLFIGEIIGDFSGAGPLRSLRTGKRCRQAANRYSS